MRGANTRYTRVRSWPRLEPQLEKPVATDSVALTDNNFVCALSSFRRRQAIQLPICRAWWTSFIQPSTVSPCLPVPKFLCPCCLFPFVSYGKYFHVNSTFFFQSFLSSGMELEIIAASLRNETTSETFKKKKSEESSQKERSNVFFLLFPITSRIYCLQLLNTLHNHVRVQIAFQKSYFPIHSSPKKLQKPNKKKREKRQTIQKAAKDQPSLPFLRNSVDHSLEAAIVVSSRVLHHRKKKEIRQKFLRNVLETRSSSTTIRAILRPTSLSLSLEPPPFHDSRLDDRRPQPSRKLEHVHRVNRGPWVYTVGN